MGPDEDILQHKEAIIDRVKQLMGWEPPGIRILMRVLSHPDLVHEVSLYFQSIDDSARCLNYEAPWSCAKEAEARYENIRYGWLGGGGGIGFDESWCANCRAKIMGDEVGGR